MSTQGPFGPGTGTDDASIGVEAWNNPGNITVEGVSQTTATLNTDASHYLVGTGFGFSIPAGATINGILVEWKKDVDIGSVSTVDNSVKIVQGGTIGGTEKADSITSWATVTPTFVSYGGAADLWGLAWAPADINAANFGAAISATTNSPGTSRANVDYVRITVTYTGGTENPPGQKVYIAQREIHPAEFLE